MKVLFDTNVILDHLLNRKPFSRIAGELIGMVENGAVIGVLGATTITTIYYLCAKEQGVKKAQKITEMLLSMFEIAPVNRLVLFNAVSAQFSDYEDAVLHEAGMHIGAQAIVTRDMKGFNFSKIATYTPENFLLLMKSLDR